MKIIKHGKPKTPAGKKIECPDCNCVFEYEYADIKAEDRPCSIPYVVCPEKECAKNVPLMS
jgi:hypothetical protein